MKPARLLCILTSIVAIETAMAQGSVLYQSAELGPLGDFGGVGIADNCLFGARFEVATTSTVTGVGGHLNQFNGAEGMFAAIVELDSSTGLPKGGPFSPGEVVASGAFQLPAPTSQDYVFPLSAVLQPGHYGLVIGKGQFGDPPSGGTIVMPLDNVDLPGSRPYFHWIDGAWSDAPQYSNLRFVVYGSPVPEPSAGLLTSAAFGVLCLSRLAKGKRTRSRR